MYTFINICNRLVLKLKYVVLNPIICLYNWLLLSCHYTLTFIRNANPTWCVASTRRVYRLQIKCSMPQLFYMSLIRRIDHKYHNSPVLSSMEPMKSGCTKKISFSLIILKFRNALVRISAKNSFSFPVSALFITTLLRQIFSLRAI